MTKAMTAGDKVLGEPERDPANAGRTKRPRMNSAYLSPTLSDIPPTLLLFRPFRPENCIQSQNGPARPFVPPIK
ncbi:hypothetical protein L596_016898 [Steinernema carpocapsae]|uniref:Uncharacterized protein n=1 Tax=Steinernema carpocapsae TaxID=34508 RepID=A0A4U5NJA4_STECR|nr:hypothetical protein L596_016898 [Steinernema carpocapsae]